MSLVISQLRTFLYGWAASNVPVGMPVVWYYPNAPRPNVDYVSLYITNFVQIGRDYSQDPTSSTSGTANNVGDREFTLQVQAYGGDTITILENLRTSLQLQSVLASLRANGLVYVNWFPIQDITDLVDSRFEQRATMDLLWRVAQIYTDPSVGNINTVETTETIFDPTGTIIINETFTIPPS